MADDDEKPEERPEPRDKTASTRVPLAVYKKAQARAKREGRSLSAIFRAWIMLFAEDEAPSPPIMPDENTRAKKRKRKGKRRKRRSDK